MEKIVKLLFFLLILLTSVKAVSYLTQLGWETPLFAWGLPILALIAVYCIIKEWVRRTREGYYVKTYGGADDGYVLYYEGDNLLKLFFSRRTDTIFFPSDVKWKEIMPGWAKERKVEIMGRIRKRVGKRLIGKDWTYEESDKEETLLSQPG
jgi:hypothetical protein